jgi:1-acyl-sn-glycerol-3-phosphate acyltransferase
MPKSRVGFVAKEALVGVGVFWYVTTNTRAVPLARKGDAHQGRVSFFPGFQPGLRGAQP